MSENVGRPLPKFGEWDVNDPSTAEGFTVVFNKARDERKAGGNAPVLDSLGKEPKYKHAQEATAAKANKKWFCCVQESPTHT